MAEVAAGAARLPVARVADLIAGFGFRSFKAGGIGGGPGFDTAPVAAGAVALVDAFGLDVGVIGVGGSADGFGAGLNVLTESLRGSASVAIFGTSAARDRRRAGSS